MSNLTTLKTSVLSFLTKKVVKDQIEEEVNDFVSKLK